MKGVLFTLKKFSQLQKKLDVLEAQKFDIGSFENLSLFQFLKYKSIISKKSKLKMQMKKSLSEAQKIVSSYKKYKAKLIDNNSINCRKYQKLIKKAEYEANLKLFKLGFISKKPIPPQFQFLQKIRKKYYICKIYVHPTTNRKSHIEYSKKWHPWLQSNTV